MKNFNSLVKKIEKTHSNLQKHAANSVNQSLTIRNWLIGYYIIEFEQNGSDKAKYGTKLLNTLAEKFKKTKGFDERSFRNFRLFYSKYPQITHFINNSGIRGSLTTELKTTNIDNQDFDNQLNGKEVVTKLSYTHIEQLLRIEDQLKRTFYEIECIKNTWSVRELKRQISSLYFERVGLSSSPKKLIEQARLNSNPISAKDIIKNIYAFEFLDLNIKDVVEESDLETALLDNLNNFIIELGNGFCFESRQKRILIGETYYFIDLVFYHRILKCHIILELKIGAFEHNDIGQLNMYLNYFKKHIIESTDNPPLGILLVADKDHSLVKYATANMDENLFVKQYLVNLPNKIELENYIHHELKNLI